MKYSAFVQQDLTFKCQLELATSSLQKPASDASNHKDLLQVRLEQSLQRLTRKLSIPKQCLVIAYIYLSRAIRTMATKDFYLSTQVAEK